MSPTLTRKHTAQAAAALVALVVVAWFSAPLTVPIEGSFFLGILPMTWMSVRGKYQAWPAFFYLFVLSLNLLREFAIMLRHVIPGGLCTYQSRCLVAEAESIRNGGGCQEWTFDMVADSCRLTTRQMDWGSMWAGVPPALIALGTLVAQMYRWQFAKLDDWARVQVTVILFLPATYAVCSLYSLRLLTVNSSDLWTPKAIFDIGDLYTAVCLYAFEQLVTKVVETRKQHDLKELAEHKNDGIKGFWELGNRLMQLGCYPYVGLCFFANLCEMVLKEFVDFWMPQFCTAVMPELVHVFFPSLVGFELDPAASFEAFKGHHGSYACKEIWGAMNLPIKALNFLVCTIAVSCIVFFEQAMHEALGVIQPTKKFLAVKGLLLVIFWQDIILGVLFPADEWTMARIDSFMLIWEACVLGILQFFAYHPNDFDEVAPPPPKEKPVEKPRTFMGRLSAPFVGLARNIPGAGLFQGGAEPQEGAAEPQPAEIGSIFGWGAGRKVEEPKRNGGGQKVAGSRVERSVEDIDWDYKEMDPTPPDRGCTAEYCVVS